MKKETIEQKLKEELYKWQYGKPNEFDRYADLYTHKYGHIAFGNWFYEAEKQGLNIKRV